MPVSLEKPPILSDIPPAQDYNSADLLDWDVVPGAYETAEHMQVLHTEVQALGGLAFNASERAIDADKNVEASVPPHSRFGGQLRLEDGAEAAGQWPVNWPATDVQKGRIPSWQPPESKYVHPPDMSPPKEDKYVRDYITRGDAHHDWTSGNIDYAEFEERVADKTPRTYQYALFKQDDQSFNEPVPFLADSFVAAPTFGVGREDGTFWHASNKLMEVGSQLMPAGEIPDEVHEANKLERTFRSSSSHSGSSYEDEKDFAMGIGRGEGHLPPDAYGKYMYKISSPDTKVVHTYNGPEVWAEGGGRIEQLMNPDFADNYQRARSKVMHSADPFQVTLPGMTTGMEFVPEKELNELSQSEFHAKYLQNDFVKQRASGTASEYRPGPEDVAIPGLEGHGARPRPTHDSSDVPMM